MAQSKAANLCSIAGELDANSRWHRDSALQDRHLVQTSPGWQSLQCERAGALTSSMMVSRIKQDISSCDLQPAALLQPCCEANLGLSSSTAMRPRHLRLCYNVTALVRDEDAEMVQALGLPRPKDSPAELTHQSVMPLAASRPRSKEWLKGPWPRSWHRPAAGTVFEQQQEQCSRSRHAAHRPSGGVSCKAVGDRRLKSCGGRLTDSAHWQHSAIMAGLGEHCFDQCRQRASEHARIHSSSASQYTAANRSASQEP